MSEQADPWTPGREDVASAPAVTPPATAGKLPDVMRLFTDTLNDVVANFVDYLLAGVGLMVPVFILTFGLVFGAIFVSAVPFVLGSIFHEEEIGALVGFLLYFVTLMATIFVATFVTAPLQASLGRAVVARLTRGERLGIGSAYSTVTLDLFPILGLTFASMGLGLLGVMMCYFPALIVAVALAFALPAILVHRLGVVDAIRLSVKHTIENPMWHLGFFGLGFVILFVGQNIPLIGPMISLPFYMAYTLRAYIGIYGSGETPNENGAAPTPQHG